MTNARLSAVWLLLVASAAAFEFDEAKYDNWHQRRGPDATGVAKRAELPLTWSADKNIRWKVPIEGRAVTISGTLSPSQGVPRAPVFGDKAI